MDEQERHANGIAMRRAVLGDAHVDRAAEMKLHLHAAANAAFQLAQHVFNQRDLDAGK